MAVVIETTVGDFTVDLYIDRRPQACKNFLKLCKMKYYNFCLFHSVQPNFLAQTGDPTGTGTGGESVYGLLYGENARYFEAEQVMPKLKHNKPGLLSMVNCGNNMLGSQFFITLGEELSSLDGEHCVFAEITEGLEVVLRLNEAICDTLHRPYKDIRIAHTVILEDPFEDPSGLIVPDMSPEATKEKLVNGRIGADEEVDDTAGLTVAEVEEQKQEREAKARATILEIVGDLPHADMAPPENVLFICKLNPVTSDDDLEIIFSRFGKVKSCEVIRDKNTGDSLQYAFVEFEDKKSCEEAYFKMDNVLIDDRRIHVDFSQSVAKMRWRGKGRGVEYFDNRDDFKEVKPSSYRDRDEAKSRSGSRRDRDHEDRDRRRHKGRERSRDRERDDRSRRRDERDRSRSDWRKQESKTRKDEYREDDKRYESKRREADSSRRREDDSRKVTSSRDKKSAEKRCDEKKMDERKRDKEINKETNGRSSSRQKDVAIKSESLEKVDSRLSADKLECKGKDKERNLKYSSSVNNIVKEETSGDTFNDSRDLTVTSDDFDKNLCSSISKEEVEVNKDEKILNNVSRRPSRDDRIQEEDTQNDTIDNDDTADDKLSQENEKQNEDKKKSEVKSKGLKRKRKASEHRRKKKRYHSSSSESSSESSDSSDSSSSSDSSDNKYGKKKKLIVAKRYYRGGKLIKEVKKKKRTKDSSDDSETDSEESSDSDTKRKRKTKKHKKIINVYKSSKRSVHSSDDSQSQSSSSEESDAKIKKRKRKNVDKHSKKRSKHVSSKKKRKKRCESSSSASENSDRSKNKSFSKKHKKSSKISKHQASLVTTTSE